MHGVADVIVEAHDATHDNLLLRNERIQLRRQHGLLVVDAIRDHEPTTTRESDADVSREERSSNRAINEPVSLLCSIGTRLNELDRNDLNQRLAGVLVVGDLGDRALVQVSHRGSERARRERRRCERGQQTHKQGEEQRQPERESGKRFAVFFHVSSRLLLIPGYVYVVFLARLPRRSLAGARRLRATTGSSSLSLSLSLSLSCSAATASCSSSSAESAAADAEAATGNRSINASISSSSLLSPSSPSALAALVSKQLVWRCFMYT